MLGKYPLDEAGTPGDAVSLAYSSAVFGYSGATVVAPDFVLTDFGEGCLDYSASQIRLVTIQTERMKRPK